MDDASLKPWEEPDTDAVESLSPQQLANLLYPTEGSELPVGLDRFALAYSAQAFQSWVKQPSPSCAAASVGT